MLVVRNEDRALLEAIRDAAGFGERAKLLVALAAEGRVVLQKLDVDSIATRLEKELAGRDVDAIVRKVREEIRAPAADEVVDDMGADEAGAAGDQNSPVILNLSAFRCGRPHTAQ